MADATADISDTPEDPAPRKRRLPLILGLVGALLLGAAGFFAVYGGFLLSPKDEVHASEGDHADAHETPQPLGDIAFVPVDPIVINLGAGSTNRHLKFRAQLEVAYAHKAEVEAVLPRVMDVLNGYLRAVNIADLESPTALIRLRAQMLRRVQIVTGEGRVRDLLVMEFVLN